MPPLHERALGYGLLAKQKATLGEGYNNRKIDRRTYSMCSLTNPGHPGAKKSMCEGWFWYSGGGDGGEHVHHRRMEQRKAEAHGHGARRKKKERVSAEHLWCG